MKYKNLLYPTPRQPLYPGAADANYFAEKALEILTAILAGTGSLAIMMLLITMA